MSSSFQNIYSSNKRKSHKNNIFPINNLKRERFHYTPSKNEQNIFYNAMSDNKNSNQFNYNEPNYEQKYEQSNDEFNNKDNDINRKNLFNNYFKYDSSDINYSNINNKDSNYMNNYKDDNNNREYTTKKGSNNYRYSMVHRIYDTNKLYKHDYGANYNNYSLKKEKSFDFNNNTNNLSMELNEERLKRQMKHDMNSKINLKLFENKNDINTYKPDNIRNTYNGSSTAYKKEYIHYDINYPKNDYLKEKIQFKKIDEHDEPIMKKDEEHNLLTRSKSNHSFKYSFIQVSDKKNDSEKSNFIQNNNNIDKVQLFKDLPATSKYKINTENNQQHYLNNKEYKQNNNSQITNDYKRNKIISTNYKYEPKFRHFYQNYSRNELNRDNFSPDEYNHYSYQSDFNIKKNNFYFNYLNKETEKPEINKDKNYNINYNNTKPDATKELRKREDINNKYRNTEKNKYNEKYKSAKDIKNNQYPVKVMIQRKDINKNNEHKISGENKKDLIYYNKKDNISIVNSINISPKKNNENRQTTESWNKYSNHKQFTRAMSEPNLNPIVKQNYNEKVESNNNKYNYKANQPENKYSNYLYEKYNIDCEKILEKCKKEKIYDEPFLGKRDSQYKFSNAAPGRYLSTNKRNYEDIQVEPYSHIKKENENNQYRNRNTKVDFNLQKNNNINNNDFDSLYTKKILEEKNTQLMQDYTTKKYEYNVNSDISKKMIDPIIKQKNSQEKTQYVFHNNYDKINNNNMNNYLMNQNKSINNQSQHQLINNKRNTNLIQNNFNDRRAKSPEQILNVNLRNQIINKDELNNFKINDQNQNIQSNNFMPNNNSAINNQNNFIHHVNKNQNLYNTKSYINIRSKYNQFNNNQINNNNRQTNNFNENSQNKFMPINNKISSSREFQNNNNLDNININKDDINRFTNFTPQIRPNNSFNINYNFKENKINFVQDNKNSSINQVKQSQIINETNLKKHNSSLNLRRNNEITITKNSANGLQNIGATCYMNATLQCLAHVEKLTKYLLGKSYEIKTNKYNYKLSNSYLEVLENLWENNTIKDYAPYNFKEIISKMNPLFEGVQANDSKDLVIFLLENMHKELNKVQKNQTNIEEKVDQYNFYNSLNVFIKYFKKNFQSILSDIFYGMYDSQMKCLNCQIITHNIQIYNILIIPLEEVRKFKNRPQNVVTITECFEYYQRPEYMTGQNQIYCNRCKQMANSVNSTSLIVGPKILIINFNRGKGLQYDIKINFDEYIDINPFIYYKNTPCKYQLIGVVTHYGPSSMSGHFIAFCKSFVDNNWYKYNDSMVSLSSIQEAKTAGVPYILFYSVIE